MTTMFWKWKTHRSWGNTLLGVWLIASGLIPLLGISVAHSGSILAVLAVAAGGLILLQR